MTHFSLEIRRIAAVMLAIAVLLVTLPVSRGAAAKETEKPLLTLADVVTLSKKGNALTWEDFAGYEGKEIGSGLYIMKYIINAEYSLLVGGAGPCDDPMYIRLVAADGRHIDIREEDVEAFLNVDSAETEKPLLTLSDVVTLSKKGNALTWEDFAGYEGKDIGSGLYVMKYIINAEYSLLVGGTGSSADPLYIKLVAANGRYIDIREEDVEAFLNVDSAETEKPLLTLSDVVTLSKKGNALTWEDFAGYEGKDVGSGLYIMEYIINAEYRLFVGGAGPCEDPLYIELEADDGRYIDIREEDVEAFLSVVSPGSSGDVNLDGTVDLLDVVLLNKYLMIGEPISRYGLQRADVDGSGEVDEVDSLTILKYIVHLIDAF